MIDVVMWDLDETMLPSQHLLALRHRSTPCCLADVPEFAALDLHPGVAETLHRLRHVRMGLVTSSPRWYVDQILERFTLTEVFEVVVTYDDVVAIKPDPEPLHLAVQRCGSEPHRAAYIGDAAVDHAACTAAGLRFIGAGWADAPTYPVDAEVVRKPLDLLTMFGSAP